MNLGAGDGSYTNVPGLRTALLRVEPILGLRLQRLPTEACHGRSDDSDERDDNRDGDAPPPMEVSLCDGAEMKRSRPK